MAGRGGLNLWGDVSLVPAAARTATASGSVVDVGDADQVAIVVTSGTVTDGTATFSLEDCATSNGSFAAVASTYIIPAATGSAADGCVLDTTSTHDSACQIFYYTGKQQFIKVVSTAAGTTTGAVYAASVLCSKKRHSPVATP